MEISKQWQKFQNIFKSELEYIRKRRENILSGNSSTINNNVDEIKKNLFGIALSGGGIRSSTFNMGILNFLNEKKILKLADYISSVSGGGFIHSYIQTKLKSKNNFDELFNKGNSKILSGDNETIKSNCDYLIPGRNFLLKTANYIKVYGAIIASFIMNLVWLFLITLFFLLIAQAVAEKIFLLLNINKIYAYSLFIFSFLLFYHYFFFILRNKKIWSSNTLNYFEGFFAVFLILIWILKLVYGIQSEQVLEYFLNLRFINLNLCIFNHTGFIINIIILFILFIVFGFFANPNILSLHRYYRDRIAGAFIKPFIPENPNVRLYDIITEKSINPYPLINTCLNLTDRGNKNMTGRESSDYFLLSPKFCGSSFTDYLPTKEEYSTLTLSTAAAISGSAVSTLMGNRTNRFISVFLYMFNAVLGYWIKNPNWKKISPFKTLKTDILIKYFTFWPYYLWNSMLGKANNKRGRVNISDGGHIENLALFELLRRRCKLIIAIDGSADPKYNFNDLENLVRRAREKLGIIIEFNDKDSPENVIRPLPSYGYSKQHYARATVRCMPDTPDFDQNYEGVLIYIKSSLKAPLRYEIEGGAGENEAIAFNYKINHPSFPHESTIDQFFDPQQWDAYYFLGRFVAEDIFKTTPANLEELIDYCFVKY